MTKGCAEYLLTPGED